jgi:hypothetical protein
MTRRPAWRTEGRYALELAGLAGLAIAQPVLDVFGRSPETFVALDATRVDIVAFGVLVAFGPAVALWLLALLARPFGEAPRRAAQAVAVGFLGALLAALLARSADLPRTAVAVLAAATGLALGIGHARAAAVRSWLAFASPAPVVFLALFLFVSPVAGLLGGASGTAAGSASGGPHPSAVLIVLDELPTISLADGDGGIDAELFPHLAALAEEATWYRNATTVAPSTVDAVPAILTGRMPEAGARPTARDHPDSIFTAFAATHDVRAVESVTRLCRLAGCVATPDDEQLAAAAAAIGADSEAVLRARPSPLPDLLDAAADVWRARAWPLEPDPGERGPDAAIAAGGDGGGVQGVGDVTLVGFNEPHELARPGLVFLAGLRDLDVPTLDVLHAPVPHQPWLLLPDGRAYDGPHPALGVEFLAWQNAHTASIGRARHLLQAQYADRLVGTIVARLKELGRYDSTVLVVTADHGISFDAGEAFRDLGASNEPELAWVPLIVRAPGQATGRVDDRNALTIDIVPTIADLAGIELPYSVDGVSLAGDARRAPGDKPMYHPPEERTVALDAAGLATVLGAQPAGQGHGPLRVWRTGTFGDLLGRRVDGLEHGDRSAMEATVDVASPGAAIRRGDETLPLWATATIVEGAGREVDVVAAIDGIVVATGHTYSYPLATRAGFLLAEPLVRDTSGEIELYEVSGTPAAPVLHPVATRVAL